MQHIHHARTNDSGFLYGIRSPPVWGSPSLPAAFREAPHVPAHSRSGGVVSGGERGPMRRAADWPSF